MNYEEIIKEAVDAVRRNKRVDLYIVDYRTKYNDIWVTTLLNGTRTTHQFRTNGAWFETEEDGFSMGGMVDTIWPQLKNMPERQRLVLKFAYYFWQWSKGTWGNLI